MFRTLTAAAALAALSLLTVSPPASAQDAGASKPKAAKKAASKKAAAKKPPAVEEPVGDVNDSLNPGQLSMADRVLTGVADCEFKQKVDIEKIEGHSGNFKLVYEKKTYIMVPQETTTGAILLVDASGALMWVQIPVKSMLMNQKEHHRLVDGCQEDEQRIAVQAAAQAGANAPFLAPSAATPDSAAAAVPALAAAKAAEVAGRAVSTDPAQVTTTVIPAPGAVTTVTTTTTALVPLPASAPAK